MDRDEFLRFPPLTFYDISNYDVLILMRYVVDVTVSLWFHHESLQVTRDGYVFLSFPSLVFSSPEISHPKVLNFV